MAEQQRCNPDPIHPAIHSKLAGCGPGGSYRHLRHQRGVVGTFNVRLLEGRGLRRRHWSALSLGPAKHLGLSRAHGEISSFATSRLAFWVEGGPREEDGFAKEEEREAELGSRAVPMAGEGEGKSPASATSAALPFKSSPATTSGITSSHSTHYPQHAAFMPSMPIAPTQQPAKVFDQGCIRAYSPARSPFSPSYAYVQPPAAPISDESFNSNEESQMPIPSAPDPPPIANERFGPSPPHHYAKEKFKSSTVHNDSNPIWGNAQHNLDDGDTKSTFQIPLLKEDLLPVDGAKICLEIRLDEEMAPTESLLVGKALSTAVGAATAATSVVGMGEQARSVSNRGMEMLGLSTDRLIGRGYADLGPLLLGLWEEEESWDHREQEEEDGGDADVLIDDHDATLTEFGKIKTTAHRTRKRVDRTGILDVWVPLYHPTAEITKPSSSSKNNGETDNKQTMESSGKIHLLISYTPNGMTPKRDDIVAFESFARRPLAHRNDRPVSASNSGNRGPPASHGPIITPMVSPLSPLLVIESRAPYLLLQYSSSRTVTSVDRTGIVKSSRWERLHRVRVHRSAVFVIERTTLMDAAGRICRMPGDIICSTPIGQEIADASAPLVTGALELASPALLLGKLAIATGGTGIKMGLAGAQSATSVLLASGYGRERKGEGGRDECIERMGGDAGVYSHVG